MKLTTREYVTEEVDEKGYPRSAKTDYYRIRISPNKINGEPGFEEVEFLCVRGETEIKILNEVGSKHLRLVDAGVFADTEEELKR